jgi:hypothetical protein
MAPMSSGMFSIYNRADVDVFQSVFGSFRSELQHELSSIGAAEVHRSSAELPQARPILQSASAKLPYIQRSVDDKCTDRSSARHHDFWFVYILIFAFVCFKCFRLILFC